MTTKLLTPIEERSRKQRQAYWRELGIELLSIAVAIGFFLLASALVCN